ncbi:MAG TPA: uracil-DNA glycosylase [Bacteroidales bacterium]|nr:uracil-DNA glycosylase [Bacteroidales bacterium]HRR49086.1 uracil-DNA glycosylase [Bacteroidales bacterium]HRT33004.1 uracil-DNA glycosylase [Bacteroidales bacterium]HRT83807.1 uracil-DNA glycosylase [Bacteroidales bacterium]
MDVKVEESWKRELQEEFDKDYFREITAFIKRDIASNIIIYPKGSLIFNAFNSTPFDKVKVVLLGQDPYYNPGQAHGLSFSVPDGVPFPPSLVNIFKELNADLGIEPPTNGSLQRWAQQGVFLLNAVLTVRAGLPASHSKIGWTKFTDAVIKKISDKKEGIVFLLWGNYARSKKTLIDTKRHYVLEAAHPSPLAKGAFFGCRHFSKTNEILLKQGKTPIIW